MPFWESQDRKSYFLYRFFDQVACMFRDHLLSQNKRDMAECVKLIGSEGRVSYEGNGVDVELVNAYAEEQLPQASKEFPCEGLRILLVSRLIPVKRVDDFFNVIFKVKQEGLKVSCVVAGTGNLEKRLREQLVNMQLDKCINMVGFVDYIPGLSAASDIVMLCSEKEGIPRSLIEAMAMRKPVIATDIGGTQELVVNGETGFLVPLGDTEAMAEKVKLFAAKPELRETMGTRGFKRVDEHFNDVKIADFLHEFYVSKIAELKKKNSPSENG
jgi:glycosyltransferase involved in cell wall biosynthesis